MNLFLLMLLKIFPQYFFIGSSSYTHTPFFGTNGLGHELTQSLLYNTFGTIQTLQSVADAHFIQCFSHGLQKFPDWKYPFPHLLTHSIPYGINPLTQASQESLSHSTQCFLQSQIVCVTLALALTITFNSGQYTRTLNLDAPLNYFPLVYHPDLMISLSFPSPLITTETKLRNFLIFGSVNDNSQQMY